MGNEVVAVNPAENLPVHSLQEMDWLGKMVAGTQLFGQTKPADCLAIVAMCHQERMSWMRFSQTYHWTTRTARRSPSRRSTRRRARMQMLWARCVSDGVRTVAPQCCCGIYTPEETDDFADAPRAASVQPPAPPVARTPADADPSICPAGTLKGRAWDSMDDATLENALKVSDAIFTPAMKDRIRSVLAGRADGNGTEKPEADTNTTTEK